MKKNLKRVLAALAALCLLAGGAAFAEDEEDYSIGDTVAVEESVILDDEEREILDEDGDGVLDFVITDEGVQEAEEDLSALEVDNSVDPNDLEINPNLPDHVINILLIGVDMREKDINSPSPLLHNDVNMILSINTQDGTIKLTSILRDLYVTIPGYRNKAKLNAAYGRGNNANKNPGDNKGAELVMRTINHNFDLNIQHYAVINFYGVASIIDSIGGIDIDMTRGEAVAVNAYIRQHKIRYDTDAGVNRVPLERIDGVQHCDGLQALIYARLRKNTGQKYDNDFNRTARQRHLLELLLGKVLKNIDVNSLTALIRTAYPYVKTNLNAGTVFSLATGVLQGGVLEKASKGEELFGQHRVPMDKTYGYGEDADGQSVVTLSTRNWQNNIESVHYFIYGEYIPSGAK